MKRMMPFILLLLAACGGEQPSLGSGSGGGLDGPIEYRVLSSGTNAAFCQEAPKVAIATTESQWVDIFDLHTDCQPGDSVEVPEVDFDNEVGAAAWWRQVPCLGHTVEITSVARVGDEVVVRATSAEPAGACATAIGQLESFLALERSDRFSGSEPVRFELDGSLVGYANKP